MSRNRLRNLLPLHSRSIESLVIFPKNLDRFSGEILEPVVRPRGEIEARVYFGAEGKVNVFGEVGEEEGCGVAVKVEE